MKSKNILSPLQMSATEKLRLYREYQNDPATTLIKALEALRSELLQDTDSKFQQIKAEIPSVRDGIDSKPEEVAQALLAIPEFRAWVRGEPGKPGKPGRNALPPSPQALLALIKPLIPKIREAEDGHTPTSEELLALIKPLIPTAKEGQMPSVEELTAIIKPLIPPPLPPLPPQSIEIEKIIQLIESRPIAASRITGFSKFRGKKYLHGGGPIITAGSNITVTRDSNGNYTIAAASSSLNIEAPSSGVIDGINTVFTFAHSPQFLVLNSAIQLPGGLDYTLTGSGPYTVTFATIAPALLSVLRSIY